MLVTRDGSCEKRLKSSSGEEEQRGSISVQKAQAKACGRMRAARANGTRTRSALPPIGLRVKVLSFSPSSSSIFLPSHLSFTFAMKAQNLARNAGLGNAPSWYAQSLLPWFQKIIQNQIPRLLECVPSFFLCNEGCRTFGVEAGDNLELRWIAKLEVNNSFSRTACPPTVRALRSLSSSC